MSARKLTVRLTSQARRDFESILLYTRQRWGVEQEATYESAIAGALKELAEYPRLGRARDDLFPGCFSRQVERHLIYYRPQATEIVVVRMLHVRQDATRKSVKPPRPGPDP